MGAFRAKPPHGSPLNRADRLTKGLIGAWPFADRAGPTARDAAQGKAGDGILTSGPAWGSSPWGPAVASAASPATITVGTCALATGAFTFGVIAKADNPGFNSSYAIRATFNSGADDFNLGIDGGGPSFWRLMKSVSFSSANVPSDASPVAGQWYRLLGIVDDAGAMSLWVDGVKQSSTATKTGAPTGAGTLSLVVGGSSRDIALAGAWIWNRPLSAAAARAWSADPFRMFRPRRLPVPLVSSAAGPIAIVVASASHAHATTSPALTQTHVVSVQNAAHAHSATSPALTQTHIVSVQSALHAQSATSPNLGGIGDIVAASGVHAHSTSSPTLTQTYVVGAQNATHAHAAASLSLTQTHIVSAADAAHAHTAASPAVTQTQAVTAQNASHAHVATSSALQIGVSIDSATHAHTATSPSLGVVYFVIPAPCVHTHTASVPMLAQTHAVSVQSTIHTVSSTGPIVAVVGLIAGKLSISLSAASGGASLSASIGAATLELT